MQRLLYVSRERRSTVYLSGSSEISTQRLMLLILTSKKGPFTLHGLQQPPGVKTDQFLL